MKKIDNVFASTSSDQDKTLQEVAVRRGDGKAIIA